MPKRQIVVAIVASLCTAVFTAAPLVTTAASASTGSRASAAVGRGATDGPAGQISPSSVTFPDMYAEDTSAPVDLTLTSTGTAPLVVTEPVKFEPDDPDQEDSFLITADGCTGATLAPGEHCTVTVVAHPEALDLIGGWIQFEDNATPSITMVDLFVTAADPTTGLYYPVTPTRVLDTRTGLGAAKHPVAGGSTVRLPVDGVGGLPPDGVLAVVLNLTVTHPTKGGYVAAYPSGRPRPTVSSINFAKGWTGANLLTVPVGADGAIDLYDSVGSVDLIADVEGWYASSKSVSPVYGAGRSYASRPGGRLLDTRNIHGVHRALAALAETDVVVPDTGSFGAANISAAAITLTATNVEAGGYLTAGAAGADLTKTSTLDLRAGVTTPNQAIVSTQPCTPSACPGSAPGADDVYFRVYNGSDRAVDLLVDLEGLYTDPIRSPYRFHTLSAPTRIVDTRTHLGATTLGPGSTRTVLTAPPITTYATGTLVGNVTAVQPTRSTFITVWPPAAGSTRPNVSLLNPTAGAIVASSAMIDLTFVQNDQQKFAIFNDTGSVNILVDVTGTIDYFRPDQAEDG